MAGKKELVVRSWTRNLSLSILSLLLVTCRTNSSGKNSETNQTEPAKSTLGLNDVSVLIPLIAVKEFAEKVPKLASPSGSSPYVFTGLDAELMKIHNDELALRAKLRTFDLSSGTNTDLKIDLSTFRLVALRFDPCANIRVAAAQDDQCLRQLRLVWQIFRAPVGPPGVKMDAVPGDANIHAIYQLTREEFSEIVANLRSLHKKASVDSSSMPLLPHPVLAKEGVASPYYEGIMGMVDRYARTENLTNVAHLSAVANGSIWQMTLLTVENGKYLRDDVSAIHAPQEGFSPKVQFLKRNGGNPDLEVSPLGNSKFYIVEPFDSRLSPDQGEAAQLSKNQRIISNIQAIENPALHDAKNLDCSSCHRALTAYARAKDAEEKQGAKIPESAEKYSSSKWDLSFATPELLLDFTGPWTLQMFSYFGKVPKITPRVINESAEVLNYIETHY